MIRGLCTFVGGMIVFCFAAWGMGSGDWQPIWALVIFLALITLVRAVWRVTTDPATYRSREPRR
jgi:hypothetical protein